MSTEDVDWSNPDGLKGFAFRQRPGSGNALGYVKFLFPNRHNVYLHDTPADSLFGKPNARSATAVFASKNRRPWRTCCAIIPNGMSRRSSPRCAPAPSAT